MSKNYVFRKFKNRFFYIMCLLCVIIAIIPLLSILYEVVSRGAPFLSVQFLTNDALHGGIGPAIQGTLILIGLTSLIGIPVGILSGVFLAEFGDNKYASFLRTINDILTEFPSIVVGITAYSVVIIGFIGIILGVAGTYSPIAGSIALSFILIPIVARTTEESLKLVPDSVREASLALGIHKWKTTLRIIVPAAKSGIITGTLLAVARISGETAPILLTILGSSYFLQSIKSPMDALPLRIFRDARWDDPRVQAEAWGVALILILIVLSLNIGVRLAARGRFKR